MSLCFHPHPIQAGEQSRAMYPTLIFDVSLKGFYRWARQRLFLLGITSCLTKYKHDFQIVRDALRKKAIIVTTDKSFPYEKKIVLPMSKPKYEVWYTLLMKALSKTSCPQLW